MNHEKLSRPARLGAHLSGKQDDAVARLFTEKRIFVRLEPEFCELADARETFLFTVNQLLRFCPNISVSAKGDHSNLVEACDELASQIHGRGARVNPTESIGLDGFDAIVNIGTEVLDLSHSATVNSNGWIARLAAGQSTNRSLFWKPERSNPLGALAAACFGAGAAFMAILNKPSPAFTEISLFTHAVGAPGDVHPGPSLPESHLPLDAFLVGCGAVSNGWAYAISRLPVTGNLQAIDYQSIRLENLGPYVGATLGSLTTPKASLIKALLAPRINVTDRADRWEFFTIRLRKELMIPPLIIAGLDNVGTRHSVQRLWPETLIDMGAAALESQVIVKHRDCGGQCLLTALSVPPNELEWSESAARETGISADLIANDPTGAITESEIESAPLEKRTQLRAGLGSPRCGFINRSSLELEESNPNFQPAVPFVTAFSGIVGAAETMKRLMGAQFSHSVHFQRSFRSGNSRAIQMKCDQDCECQRIRATRKVFHSSFEC